MCKDNECEILNHIKKYQKEYREKNRDKLIELRKQKYSENSEVILAKIKEYYKFHKDEIQKKHSTKSTCICGGSYTYANKTNHMKTKKHLDYLAANPSLESASSNTTNETNTTTEPASTS